MYFEYGSKETEYLKKKDKLLGAAIDRIGHIERAVDCSLFSSVVHHIIGQQISTSAQGLSALKGIGVWTAEMIMTFCMQRPDVVSFGDLAIHRGMRMLYHHRSIDRKKFEKYAKRYSPYGTVASLYLWAIAGGAVPEMRDYAPKKKKETEMG
ncbi:DNA-3-methyladenine glycosylase family protein [Clostridium sp. Marseille-P2415]|uniref:DNA-3-methyladenine glycosylase family protein n=1 Tax=Clostridium sp. Marseille-P2415 TaxID=1805471 RepID=UPI0009886FDB|nr:hypothetical protein [Clostridium sp. Marseille-P2415]